MRRGTHVRHVNAIIYRGSDPTGGLSNKSNLRSARIGTMGIISEGDLSSFCRLLRVFIALFFSTGYPFVRLLVLCFCTIYFLDEQFGLNCTNVR